MRDRKRKGGISFISLLTLVFIALKLAHIADWPWIWVVSPIWISTLIFSAIFAFILIGGRVTKGKW